MRRRIGLHAKFNIAVVPLVALGITAMIWMDYRHEYETLMAAHGVHVSVVGTEAPTGPMDPWSLPGTAARRSLAMHVAFGAALLLGLVLALNAVLHGLILRPVALMRQRLAGMERGQWRGRVESADDDEMGALYDGMQRLGPEIDAIVSHVLHAERLAMVALLSKRFEGGATPEVARIIAAANRLAASDDAEVRESAHEVALGAAGVLRVVHEFDGVFAAPAARRRLPTVERAVEGAGEGGA